ncbi:MAG: hypothetical protein AAF296_09305 [Pseudomonadota bacterium]
MKTIEILKKYRWLIAGVIVIALGYVIGKDLALRDNAKDQAQIEASSE